MMITCELCNIKCPNVGRWKRHMLSKGHETLVRMEIRSWTDVSDPDTDTEKSTDATVLAVRLLDSSTRGADALNFLSTFGFVHDFYMNQNSRMAIAKIEISYRFTIESIQDDWEDLGVAKPKESYTPKQWEFVLNSILVDDLPFPHHLPAVAKLLGNTEEAEKTSMIKTNVQSHVNSTKDDAESESECDYEEENDVVDGERESDAGQKPKDHEVLKPPSTGQQPHTHGILGSYVPPNIAGSQPHFYSSGVSGLLGHEYYASPFTAANIVHYPPQLSQHFAPQSYFRYPQMPPPPPQFFARPNAPQPATFQQAFWAYSAYAGTPAPH